jgi:hypothetical protein
MAPLDPVWQGVLLGIPVGLLALLIYRLASNQSDIARTKTLLKANLLALRLFRDDLGVVLRTQGQIFRLVGRYLRLGLVPLAILLVPVLLLLIQIEARFAYRPMAVGKPALLTVTLDSTTIPDAILAAITASEGIRVETPAFRQDSERRVLWRISPTVQGEHAVTIRLDDREHVRHVWAGEARPELLVPTIYRSRDIRTFGSPGEVAIDADSGITAISVEYEPGENHLAGLSTASWAMFISSLACGFALRRPLGVVF